MLKLKARLDEEAIEQQVGIFLLPTEDELKEIHLAPTFVSVDSQEDCIVARAPGRTLDETDVERATEIPARAKPVNNTSTMPSVRSGLKGLALVACKCAASGQSFKGCYCTISRVGGLKEQQRPSNEISSERASS